VWGLRSQISHAIVPTTITPQIGRITWLAVNNFQAFDQESDFESPVVLRLQGFRI